MKKLILFFTCISTIFECSILAMQKQKEYNSSSKAEFSVDVRFCALQQTLKALAGNKSCLNVNKNYKGKKKKPNPFLQKKSLIAKFLSNQKNKKSQNEINLFFVNFFWGTDSNAQGFPVRIANEILAFVPVCCATTKNAVETKVSNLKMQNQLSIQQEFNICDLFVWDCLRKPYENPINNLRYKYVDIFNKYANEQLAKNNTQSQCSIKMVSANCFFKYLTSLSSSEEASFYQELLSDEARSKIWFPSIAAMFKLKDGILELRKKKNEFNIESLGFFSNNFLPTNWDTIWCNKLKEYLEKAIPIDIENLKKKQGKKYDNAYSRVFSNNQQTEEPVKFTLSFKLQGEEKSQEEVQDYYKNYPALLYSPLQYIEALFYIRRSLLSCPDLSGAVINVVYWLPESEEKYYDRKNFKEDLEKLISLNENLKDKNFTLLVDFMFYKITSDEKYGWMNGKDCEWFDNFNKSQMEK